MIILPGEIDLGLILETLLEIRGELDIWKFRWIDRGHHPRRGLRDSKSRLAQAIGHAWSKCARGGEAASASERVLCRPECDTHPRWTECEQGLTRAC